MTRIEIGKRYEPKDDLKNLAVSGNLSMLAQGCPVEVFAVVRGFVLAAHVGCAPFVFVAERFLEHFQVCGQNQAENIAEKLAESFAANGKKADISKEFLRRVQSAGCQCGKQKLETYPLCGLCFSRLPDELKKALCQKKGGELEHAYNFAVENVLVRRMK